MFVVRKDSDRIQLLWKATVRIGCVRVDSLTNRIETYQLLNLAQFMRVWHTFQAHATALQSAGETDAVAASRLDDPMRVGVWAEAGIWSRIVHESIFTLPLCEYLCYSCLVIYFIRPEVYQLFVANAKIIECKNPA